MINKSYERESKGKGKKIRKSESKIFEVGNWKVAQLLRSLTAKPKDMNLIARTQMMEREKQLL